MSNWVGSVLFVVAIAIAIGLHEWGHFITARWFGMRAERFFIGFGPTLWSTRRGETEYGLKWLPLGGFVRIAGMSSVDQRQPPVADAVFDRDAVAADRRAIAEREGLPLEHVPAVPPGTWARLAGELDRRGTPPQLRDQLLEATRARSGAGVTLGETAAVFTQVAGQLLEDTGRLGDLRYRVLRGDEGRFFQDRPAWQRAIVLAAGSTMHFLQAIVLLFVAFWAFGVQAVPVVEATLPGSPAAVAGLQPGDRILAVDGQPVKDFAGARALIESRPGSPIALTVASDGGSGPQRELRLTTALVVRRLDSGSALAGLGLQRDDRIVAVAGRPVSGVDSLRAAAGPGQQVTVTFERYQGAAGASRRFDAAVPADQLDELARNVSGLAGFVPGRARMGPLTALQNTFVGEGSFPQMTKDTIHAIGSVFGPEGLRSLPQQLSGGKRDPEGGASLVGITVLAGQGTSSAGLLFLLGLIASLNVFVGVFNLVPLPPLDGGHLAVLAVERGVNLVRRVRGLKPDFSVDPRVVTPIAVMVILLVGAVALAFLFLDITNPLQLPQ